MLTGSDHGVQIPGFLGPQHLSYRATAFLQVFRFGRLSRWILGASRTGLLFGKGCRGCWGGLPPTLSEKRGRCRQKSRQRDGFRTQVSMEGKKGFEPMPAIICQHAHMPLRMTFRSHAEKTCDALSFKAT